MLSQVFTDKNFIKSIQDRHEKLFPETDLRQQQLKFNEEYIEWLKEDEEIKKLFEFVDMIIVIIGYNRFSDYDYQLAYVNFLYNHGSYIRKVNMSEEQWEDLIKVKMTLNENRDWNNDNGYYKHI